MFNQESCSKQPWSNQANFIIIPSTHYPAVMICSSYLLYILLNPKKLANTLVVRHKHFQEVVSYSSNMFIYVVETSNKSYRCRIKSLIGLEIVTHMLHNCSTGINVCLIMSDSYAGTYVYFSCHMSVTYTQLIGSTSSYTEILCMYKCFG